MPQRDCDIFMAEVQNPTQQVVQAPLCPRAAAGFVSAALGGWEYVTFEILKAMFRETELTVASWTHPLKARLFELKVRIPDTNPGSCYGGPSCGFGCRISCYLYALMTGMQDASVRTLGPVGFRSDAISCPKDRQKKS